MLDLNRFKCAIFDLDGTLLDSTKVWEQVDIDFMKNHGLEITDEFVQEIKSHNFETGSVYVVEKYNLKETPKEVMDEWFEMAKDGYANHIGLKPGVHEFLEYLKENLIKMVVATSSDRCLYEDCLKRNGIYDYFEDFTQTNEVQRGKKFPDVYLRAADKAGFKPCECVVFEDIYTAISAAKQGGFYTVAMCDESSDDDKDSIIKISDIFIEDYKSLMNNN